MKELFKCAIELKKQMVENDYLNPPKTITQLNEKLDELLAVDFSDFHRKEQAFIKRLNKHRQSIFTFLTDPNVPPDNNASERAIRNVKVKGKVSGQFRNKEGKGAKYVLLLILQSKTDRMCMLHSLRLLIVKK